MSPNANDFEALRRIGWPDTPALREAAAGDASIARVIGQHRSAYVVARHADESLSVQPPAAWTRRGFDPLQRAVVGDWVRLDAASKNILGWLPRSALLKRAAAGEHYKPQAIAANIDHALVVVGLDHDFNPRRIERYLLVIQSSGAAPVLVLSKRDLCADPEARIAAIRERLPEGVALFALNLKSADEVRQLEPFLGPGRTVVLVGSSGAGKSTLTNTLLGREKMKTAAVRGSDSRGRHTTTHRALTPLPPGACLIDTPGMRELKLTGEEDLADGGFDDIEALAAECRFRDCAHGNEPGCAVRAAIEAGSLDGDRFRHYCKLRDERDAAAQTLAERRDEAKQLHRGFHQRLKDKYGRR
jgi:ribosome biogenesis GTPase